MWRLLQDASSSASSASSARGGCRDSQAGDALVPAASEEAGPLRCVGCRADSGRQQSRLQAAAWWKVIVAFDVGRRCRSGSQGLSWTFRFVPVQEVPRRNEARSRGRSHGAAVAAGIAAAQVRKQAERNKVFTLSEGDRMARLVFSDVARAHSNTAVRHVQLGCNCHES